MHHFDTSSFYYPPEHSVFTEGMQENNTSNSNLNNIMKNLFLFSMQK